MGLVLVVAGIPTFLMGAGSVLAAAPKKKKIIYGGGMPGASPTRSFGKISSRRIVGGMIEQAG